MSRRTLGVYEDESVVLTSDGSVLRLRSGKVLKRVGIAPKGLFDGVERQSCEGTTYGRCGNSGIVSPTEEQRKLLGQIYLTEGDFRWHGPETRVCCPSCSHPPR